MLSGTGTHLLLINRMHDYVLEEHIGISVCPLKLLLFVINAAKIAANLFQVSTSTPETHMQVAFAHAAVPAKPSPPIVTIHTEYMALKIRAITSRAAADRAKYRLAIAA